jgi:hypothetical protein
MKKIALSLAGVLTAVAFAPEASALPVFARQTGMACSACHFQHFPMLNGFGRAFKAAAFTMMGAQGKVEGDHLSIPDVVNFGVLTTMGYVKTNQTVSTPAEVALGLNNPGDGTVYVPGTNGEFSLFLGGRTSEFSGALAEIGLTQSGGVGAGLASAKFPMLWEMGGAHVGIVPFTTDAQGASYGFELLNTGANAVHTMLFAAGDVNGSIGGTLSAQQYIGTGTAATGAAIVANNDMGFINVTKFHQVNGNLGFVHGAKLDSTYLRLAGTFDLNGWDAGAGLQNWSGQSTDGTLTLVETKATAIDGQMQGALSGMPVGFYASYATAPTSTLAGGNAYNGPHNINARKSMNFSAELGIVPEVTSLGLGIRRAKNGDTSGVDADNSLLLSVNYKLMQNMLVQVVYTKQSGSAWDAVTTGGNQQYGLSLSTIW